VKQSWQYELEHAPMPLVVYHVPRDRHGGSDAFTVFPVAQQQGFDDAAHLR
jgi:hypothetical protein